MEKRETCIIFTIDTYKYVLLFVIDPLCIILSQKNKLFTAGEYKPPGKTQGYTISFDSYLSFGDSLWCK